METSLGSRYLFAAGWDVRRDSSQTLRDSALKYLHYEVPESLNGITWFGATPELSNGVAELPFIVPRGGHYSQRTIASLENVTHIEIYSGVDHDCTGLLLTYTDGFQESLG
jgi:hypothetical protein